MQKTPGSQSLSADACLNSRRTVLVGSWETGLVSDARLAYGELVKRGLVQFCLGVLALGLCLRAAAATDPFLQLSSPILTNGQVQFTLTGESGVYYVVEASSNLQSWLPVATNVEASITRLITLPASNGTVFYRAGRDLLPVFSAAIAARQSVQIFGNNIWVNSYDSSDLAHDNPFDPNEVKAGGDIACAGDILATNAVIHGMLKNVPGGILAISNAIVGDLTWTNAGTIQPGWYRDDFRFVYQDVTPPFTSGFPPAAGSGTNHTILLSGDFMVIGNFKPTGSPRTILVVGNVRLYVTGDFVIPSTWDIKIEPGGSLKLFVGTLTGIAVKAEFSNVITPLFLDASCFQLYGLPSNTSVTWSGNNACSGTIYAPQATLTMGGGGNSVYDYVGACVVHSIRLNGHFNFHFDEDLKRKGPFR